MSSKFAPALLCLALLSQTSSADQEKEPVYRKVSAGLIEKLLKDLGIRHKKIEANAVTTFDFERNNFKIRLSNFEGHDLMLEALFNPVAVERINAWNVRAKFSRGVLYPGNGKPHVAVESNLDCEGGVTSGAIKQFIHRFESEVQDFAQFLAEAEGGPAPPAASSPDTIFPQVTDELIVKVLKNLNITYNRQAIGAGAVAAFEFKRNGIPVRLLSFGGTDLMLTAEFRKTTLKEVNDYNLKKKLVRVVLYRQDGREYTALERNLDAEGGVTENILRTFITSYDAEAREFERFLGK